MDKNIVYIADLDQDIDDLIAIEYLVLNKVLEYVVLDPVPTSLIGIERVNYLIELGVLFEDNLLDRSEILFIGGALTKVKNALEEGKSFKLMVMNGGFVGSNIVPEDKQLNKFKDKEFVRTYNLNLDVESSEYVLNHSSIESIYLIGKNVCHDERNTIKEMWKDIDFIKKYNIKSKKRLHDLLMVSEGLNLIKNIERNLIYKQVKIINKKESVNGNTFVKWGSFLSNDSNINVAVYWK